MLMTMRRGLHGVLEQADLLGLAGCTLQRGGVARATGEHQVLGLVDGLLEVLGVVHGQDRGNFSWENSSLAGSVEVTSAIEDLESWREPRCRRARRLSGSHAGDAVIERRS